ncbi:MAG: hypothetical protein H0X42_03945 [Solirubrobacterales bacterium]|nr:hypothetical protein [Solirubrobacterales bacterium]
MNDSTYQLGPVDHMAVEFSVDKGDFSGQPEIMLIGVEEPSCLIHAPNESVDTSEIERIALAEALFLSRYT